MFCNGCGAELQAGTRFCNYCGTPVPAGATQGSQTAQQPTQTVQQPTQTAYTAQPAQSYPPVQPVAGYGAPVVIPVAKPVVVPLMTRKQFLRSDKVSTATKTKCVVSWGVLALCVIVLLLALNTALNSRLDKVPAIGLLLSWADAGDLDEVMESAERDLERLEIRKDLSAGEARDRIEKEIEALEKLIEAPSLLNFYAYATVAEDGAEAVPYLQGAVIGVVVWFLGTLFWIVLGGLLKNTPLTVIAIFPMLSFVLPLGGILWTVLGLIAYIVLVVLYAQINGEFKAYRRAPQMF